MSRQWWNLANPDTLESRSANVARSSALVCFERLKPARSNTAYIPRDVQCPSAPVLRSVRIQAELEITGFAAGVNKRVLTRRLAVDCARPQLDFDAL